jgi:hypothetical protein
MANKAGGFVDDQQVGVFEDDGEQFFQARTIYRRDTEARRKIAIDIPELNLSRLTSAATGH